MASSYLSQLMIDYGILAPDTDPEEQVPDTTDSDVSCDYSGCQGVTPGSGNKTWFKQRLNAGDGHSNTVEIVCYLYVMPAVCILGIVLNSLTVLVLSRRLFRSPTYLLMCALAICDVITAALTLPGGLSRCHSCVHTNTRSWAIFEVYVFVPITNMSETLSAWTTILLAVERLLAVYQLTPDSSHAVRRVRVKAAILALMLLSVAINSPYFFTIYITEDGKAVLTAFGRSLSFQVYSWIRASLAQFIPLLSLIALNFLLLLSVRRSRMRCRRMSVTSRSSYREKAQLRLTLMLTGSVLLFILGHIPVALAYTVIFKAVFGQQKWNSDFYDSWRAITHVMAMTSYALDFLVYSAVNRYFRKACADMLVCERPRRKITDLTSISSFNKFETEGTPRETKY